AVGGRNASHPFSACAELVVVELPFKDDLAMARGQRRRRESSGSRRPGKRFETRSATAQGSENENRRGGQRARRHVDVAAPNAGIATRALVPHVVRRTPRAQSEFHSVQT